jgi:hypothetical protein
LPACGIGLTGDKTTTEMFRGIAVSGDLFVNRELTLEVELKDGYPVPVRVACFYENREALTPEQRRVPFHERATLVGERTLPPTDAESPAADLPSQTLRFTFSVPQPGRYFAGCLTPAAPDNGVSLSFEIRPAVDAAAQTQP